MYEGIIIGGSGGQGVLFIGRLLAEAGLIERHEVVWLPSYGAEKRGGTVWCHITIADEKIGELFVVRPTAAIAMNLASLVKLEPMMQSGSLLVVNQSLVSSKVSRKDVRVVSVPAIEMAMELGDDGVANLVILGALLARCPVVSLSGLTAVMDNMLAKSERLGINKQALNLGYAFARGQETTVK